MKLLKQKNISWIGPLIDSLYTALPLLSIINFLSILTVLYSNVRDYILPIVPWITLGWFVVFMIILVIGMMAFMYLYVLPSIWTFRNKQMNSYESDVMVELRAIRKELEELKIRVK